MNTYPEHKLVQKCLLQIEDRLGWGSSLSWHNDVFMELSEAIQEKTHVLLSPTTLKRVWGKIHYENAPSISTLNTLSQFAGYANWRDFKNSVEVKKPSWIKKKITPNLGVIMASAAVMTIVFISLFSLKGSKDTPTEFDITKIEFSSRPIADGLPNSVVFDFDLKNIESDSIYIQQFWDETKTIKLESKQQQATGIYYFPGYFKAKLLVDGKIITEHDLFIKSNGWLGTVDYEPVPKYLYSQDLINNGMSFSSAIINEIKSSEEPLVSSFHYVKSFEDLSADNFSLKTSIKNVYNDKWAVCQTTRIVILGTSGALIIPFSIPGCVSDIGLLLNDVFLSGKKQDLSAFGIDISNYRDIEISVKQKQIKVLVDGIVVYSGSYNESVGNLVGIRYRFLGAGEVIYLNITDESKNEVIINEDFNDLK